MIVAVVLSIAFPVCFIVVLIGCLDCLIRKRRLEGFRSRDATDARNTNAFSVDICDVPNTSEQVTIEPLPDILSKVSAAPALRPQITFVERGEHASTAPLVSVQRSFPRGHLTYLNEIGSGWFGKAIESEAIQIVAGSVKSHVVVKMLKDDASKLEQKQFLDEVHAYRCLDHTNLMSLLGQCTEAAPFLVILEFAVHGNLKSFLIQHNQNLDIFVTKNRFISLALDAAAGLACLHRHDYIHNDLAARNCLVMSDYTLKIGDYGISDNLFKNEYYSTGAELLPVRWMAPETLVKSGGVWTTQPHGKMSDMWSFGILLWEICSVGERPYDMLTDEAVLQGVIQDRLVLPADVDMKLPFKDKLWSIMTQCWQDASSRLDVEQAYDSLEQLFTVQPVGVRLDTVGVMLDFDQKWNQLKQNQERAPNTDTDLGSRIALAGSFATDDSSSPPDKPSILDGDAETVESIRSDDLIIDVGDDSTFTPEFQLPATILANPVKAAENPGQATIQRKISSSSEDHVFVENEFTKTSVLQSHMTPLKSFDHTAGTTVAPLVLNQSSSSGVHAQDSYSNTAQIVANEKHISPSIQEAKNKGISSIKNDLSLDVGHSLHQLTSGTQETAIKDIADSSNFDSRLQTDDDDFSDFVRTSPSAPSLDFTDFASADTNISDHDQHVNNNLQFEKASLSDVTGSNEDKRETVDDLVAAADENTTVDNYISAFSDFVTSDPLNQSASIEVITSDPLNQSASIEVITVDVNTTAIDNRSGLVESFIREENITKLEESVEASDSDGDTFSDFVSSAPAIQATSTTDVKVAASSVDEDDDDDGVDDDVASLPTLASQDLSLDMSFPKSGPESQNPTEILSTSPPHSNTHLQVLGSLKDFEYGSETSSIGLDVEKISVEKLEADHNQNIFSSEQFPSNLSSLSSDMSLLIHDVNVETSNVESRKQEMGTDAQKPTARSRVEEPLHASEGVTTLHASEGVTTLHASEGVTTEAVEQGKSSSSLGVEESNNSLESFDFCADKLSLVAGKPIDPADDDVGAEKVDVSAEKVDDVSAEKADHANQESGDLDVQEVGLSFDLLESLLVQDSATPSVPVENLGGEATAQVEVYKPQDDLLGLDLIPQAVVSHEQQGDLQKSKGDADVTSAEKAEQSFIDF
ncbi:hypothetical protein BsWGS_21166 [Bradybaena similaris]